MFLEISQACNFIKKETLAQVLSCEFCEISKNTFSYRTPPVTASALANISICDCNCFLQNVCDLKTIVRKLSFRFSSFLFSFSKREGHCWSVLRSPIKVEGFAKIVNVFLPLTIFAKLSILYVWQGSRTLCI